MAVSFISQPSKLVLAGNPVTFQVLADNFLQEPGVKKIFHRVAAIVSINLKEIKIDFQCKTPEGMPESLVGQTDIEISSLLEKEKTGHFTFPETGENFFFKKDILDIVNISVRESWGIPLEQSEIVTSNSIYVLQGKLNSSKLGELNDLGSNFFSKITSSGQFLTDQPSEKQTDIYAPERLYWFTDKAFSATLKIVINYTDGSSETKNTDLQPLVANSIYEVLTSYKRIRMGTIKKIESYSVQIFSGSIPVSSLQSYIIDYRHQQYARYFLVRNKYGVYDLFRTIGKANKKRKIAKQSISLNLPNNFKSTDREIRQVSSNSKITYALNSGFLNSSEAEWLSELLDSTDAYWLKKGKAYPVIILDSDNQINRDDEPNNYLEFDIQHALNDDIPEEFTALEPIDLPGDYSIDYNTDYFTEVTTPDPEEETWTAFYQSDFSNWVIDSDPLFPLQPVGLDISSSYTEVSATNDNNRLKLTVTNPTETVDVFFKAPAQIYNPGKYKFTIIIDQLQGTPRIEFSNPYGYRNLIQGLNIIEMTFTALAFARIVQFQPGSTIISNITIEKLS